MNMQMSIKYIWGIILMAAVCKARIPDEVIYEKLKKISQISPTTAIQIESLNTKINELRDMKFDPNRIVDKKDKLTPLMMIVDISDEQAALKLIDIVMQKGADINKVSKTEKNPVLTLITMHDRPAIVQKLLDYGANPLLKNKTGETAVHSMVKFGLSDDLKKILNYLQAQATLETAFHEEDNYSNTPFLKAVKSDKDYDKIKNIVDLLLAYGADPNYENSKGESVMNYLQAQNDPTSKALYNHIKQKLVYHTYKALEKIPAAREDITMRVSEYLGVGLPKKSEQSAEKIKKEIVSHEEQMPEVE